MPSKSISRRTFLKAGCITMAAGGLTVCGASMAIPAPDEELIELPSLTYGEKNMNKRTLIAYASATGTTVDVAAAIGETLAASGISVDVKPVKEAPPLEGYDAFVIGSAVQHANWLPEAVDFVKDHQRELNGVPVALFCVQIQNLGEDVTSRQNRLAYLDEVRLHLHPVEEAFFAGRFNRRGAALLMPSWLARFVPTIDLRDWKKINAWAADLKPKLTV